MTGRTRGKNGRQIAIECIFAFNLPLNSISNQPWFCIVNRLSICMTNLPGIRILNLPQNHHSLVNAAFEAQVLDAKQSRSRY